jgi:hypothetical protein
MQYGEIKYNQPTGAPNVMVAPPADVAPAPVAPLTDEQRRKKALADMAELKLEQLKNSIESSKTPQGGKTFSPESLMEVQSKGNRVEKDIDAELKASKPKKTIPTTSTETITPPVTSEIPEGRIPAYPNPKYNKKGADVIGQGGWHFYQGQMGPQAEAEWKKVYGETNQSYDTVLKDIQSGKLKGASVNAKGQGGSFAREATVPNYIKGSASLKGMGALGATAAFLGLAGSEKGQEAMERAVKAIKDIGVSPDIFTNKAEEYGSLGRTYVNAGNPNYKRELMQKLESTKDPEFKKILQEELEKLNSLSGAVPPPKR